ncbi:SDR family NAD(P)-dependent oxidoreductase [Halococcus sediminicola]|uniref:SDR family NAD(P)-dependent oxidoreductase n=1 Tax=Halococcus sediminicola TaxID=1264579 RepID=UPI001F3AE10B|nr:SDR family NAD(P)-dependent oxidoreductase [Halococcus sediminicola]
MPDRNSAVSVSDKNAVVIGGTTGIGRGIAHTFAMDGANVIATSRSPESVQEITNELRGLGAETAEVTCNVRERRSIENLRDVAFDTFDTVDIVVNSAGDTDHASLLEMDDAQWEYGIDVFLSGVFRSCQVFGRAMDQGSIINSALHVYIPLQTLTLQTVNRQFPAIICCSPDSRGTRNQPRSDDSRLTELDTISNRGEKQALHGLCSAF